MPFDRVGGLRAKFFEVLSIETRASCMLGKPSAPKLHPVLKCVLDFQTFYLRWVRQDVSKGS
jgi:hypothetical protein